MSIAPTPETLAPQPATPKEVSHSPEEMHDAYLLELAEGVAELEVASIGATASFKPNEVGALRMAACAAGIPAFEYLGQPHEGERLKDVILEWITDRNRLSHQSVVDISRIASHFIQDARIQRTLSESSGVNSARLSVNLSAARGMVFLAMQDLSACSDEDLPAYITKYIDTDVLADETSEQMRTRALSQLAQLSAQFDVDIESITRSVSYLQLPRLDPEQGWVHPVAPPAGFESAYKAALTHRAAQQVVEKAVSPIAAPADIPPIRLSKAPLDDLAEIGRRRRAGWPPIPQPQRYTAENGREYISYTL